MNKFMFLCALALLLCGAPAVAFADAQRDCMKACDHRTSCNAQKPGDCPQHIKACYVSRCRANARMASGAYGAIAYDQGQGGFGLSDAEPKQARAETSAVDYCNMYGFACVVKESFVNTCAVIAKNGNRGVAWAVGDDIPGIERKAIAQCDQVSGPGTCQVVLERCYAP